MQTHITVAKAALVMALCSSGWSLASETLSDDTPLAAQSVTEVSGLGVPLGSGQLEDYRGGFDLVKNDMQLSGSVADNSARNFTTGSNYIADGSFSNASGLPIVIQNSGANVLIQNATIFNLQLQ